MGAGQRGDRDLFGRVPAYHWIVSTIAPIRVAPGGDASTLWATWFRIGDESEIADAIVTHRWWGGRWDALARPTTVQIPLTNLAGWVVEEGDEDP